MFALFLTSEFLNGQVFFPGVTNDVKKKFELLRKCTETLPTEANWSIAKSVLYVTLTSYIHGLNQRHLN